MEDDVKIDRNMISTTKKGLSCCECCKNCWKNSSKKQNKLKKHENILMLKEIEILRIESMTEASQQVIKTEDIVNDKNFDSLQNNFKASENYEELTKNFEQNIYHHQDKSNKLLRTRRIFEIMQREMLQ